MIKDNSIDFIEKNEIVPMDETNEWLKSLNNIKLTPKPVFASKEPVYKFPVQVSRRQQRGLNYG